MSVPTIPGITAETITTDRVTTRVLFSGSEDGEPVLMLHGNFSSATWWEETMVAMPDRFRAIAPDQRSFGDSDPELTIDATQGMRQFIDDAIALMDHLGYERFHLVGNSLGGIVAWWMMAEVPERLISVAMAGPGSPYGFGGTRGVDGTPTADDFAGSGGGLITPTVMELIAAGDRSTDSPFSPRSVLRLLVWGPPDIPEREDAFVEAMLKVKLGDHGLPGDKTISTNWPFVAPGKFGPTNAMSPKYIGDLIDRILASEPKVKVLWIYGDKDVAVSNSAASDPGTWGPQGLLPGFPGADAYPPQPMMDQIRKVLDDYTERGGSYEEVAVEGSGHVPFLTHQYEFNSAFHAYLEEASEQPGGKR